ncbi:zinc finger protein 728-like [Acanthopagrus latus]|uniref:zinc finger protein 728-like n=1 Tax=Acanthopagrus latus TaxID=8177 RepID=UPI00187BD4F1|nr:zinc finger protein 728-like [Acanthopagrus latus]XP_036932043.1 zinc finger protein 728-like [Acanthopagrus latus]
MSDRLTREFSAQLSTTMDSTLRRAMYEIMKIFETSLHDHLMELVQRGEEIANLKIKLQRAEIKLGERLCGGDTETETNEKQVTEPQKEPENVLDASGHTSDYPEIDFEVPSDWCAPLGSEAVPKQEVGLCPSVRLRKLHIPLWQVPIKKEVDIRGIDSHQQTVGGRKTTRGSSLQKHRHTMSVQRTHRGPVKNDIKRLLQDIREEYTNLTDTPQSLRRGRRSQTGREQEKAMEIIGDRKQTAKTKFKSTEQKSVENDSHKIYTCKFCKKKFQTLFGLSVHARSHKRCQGCKKEFSFPSYLNSHKLYCAKLKELLAKQAESTDPPKHQPCVGEAASDKGQVIDKDDKALSPSKKTVTKKEDNTPSSQSKKRVISDDTPSPPSKQEVIKKRDDAPSPTKKQVIIKVEKLPLPCSLGELSVQKDGHTKKHTSSFSNQKDESISQMREHIRGSGGRKPFRCSMCPKKFRFKRALNTHITKMHKDQVNTSQANAILSWTLRSEKTEENKEVLISPCKDTSQASNRNNIKRKSKHDRKPGVIWKEMGTLCPDGYTCLKCPKVTKTKYLLIAHFRSHTGEKPFKCDHCAAKFRCVWQRNNHRKKCTGILFQCEKCDKKFLSKTKYDRHVLKYHRDWHLFCKICGKGFFHKGRLKNHMQSHKPVYS